MKKFYGIISTTTTRTEEYEKKLKNGKTEIRTREVTVPKEITVQSSQPDRLGARKELEAFARKCNVKVTYIGAFA